MVIDMNEKWLVTLEQLREFLAGPRKVEFQAWGEDEERYRAVLGVQAREWCYPTWSERRATQGRNGYDWWRGV